MCLQILWYSVHWLKFKAAEPQNICSREIFAKYMLGAEHRNI
jgi:hypothetical protein